MTPLSAATNSIGLPDWFVVGSAFVVGLIFGSFGSVVAWRLPRGESLGGRSKCPHCGQQIGSLENIPVVSWIVLRGRCRRCGRPISVRYPLIEVATGALFAVAIGKFGLSLEGVLFGGFFWVLVVLTQIDLAHKLLPNKIVYPSFVAGWIGLGAAAITADDLAG